MCKDCKDTGYITLFTSKSKCNCVDKKNVVNTKKPTINSTLMEVLNNSLFKRLTVINRRHMYYKTTTKVNE